MRQPFERPSRNTSRNLSATDTAVPCMSCWTPRILISPRLFRADATSSLKYQIHLLLPEEVQNQICMQVLIFKERISFMLFCFCLQRSVLWPHQTKQLFRLTCLELCFCADRKWKLHSLNCKLKNKISYYIFSLLDEKRKEQFIQIC